MSVATYVLRSFSNRQGALYVMMRHYSGVIYQGTEKLAEYFQRKEYFEL